MTTPIKQIFGTAVTVINTTTNLAAGNFSGTPTLFHNTDAAVPQALQAQAILTMPTWASTPVAGAVVELWGVTQNTDVGATLSDQDWPSSTLNCGARYLGAFIVSAVLTLQRRTINISLKGINDGMYFYLKNMTAQSMTNNAGTACTLKIAPFAYGV